VVRFAAVARFGLAAVVRFARLAGLVPAALAAAGFDRAAGAVFVRDGARRGGWAPAVAAGFGLAAARERARAGVSDGAVAAPGASGAGVARLALRREGRVRGRLVRTSRSLPSPEESLGGMARFLPIGSRGAARGPRHRERDAVSTGAVLATVASERRAMPCHASAISWELTLERYGGVSYVPVAAQASSPGQNQAGLVRPGGPNGRRCQ
jgi:hypothetical protein